MRVQSRVKHRTHTGQIHGAGHPAGTRYAPGFYRIHFNCLGNNEYGF